MNQPETSLSGSNNSRYWIILAVIVIVLIGIWSYFLYFRSSTGPVASPTPTTSSQGITPNINSISSEPTASLATPTNIPSVSTPTANPS